MNDEANGVKYRGLSIAALVTGLSSVITIPLIFRLSSSFNAIDLTSLLTKLFVVFILGIGLPVTALICGSIELSRMKRGNYNNKGKGFAITGIVLGSIFLLPGILLFYEEILFNTVAINTLIFKYEQIPSR